jgi:hypothetical protein
VKVYTFKVGCSFNTQWGFSESEVSLDPDGHEGDVEPSAEALHALRVEIEALLSETLSVDGLEVWAESDDLVGTEEEPEPPGEG